MVAVGHSDVTFLKLTCRPRRSENRHPVSKRGVQSNPLSPRGLRQGFLSSSTLNSAESQAFGRMWGFLAFAIPEICRSFAGQSVSIRAFSKVFTILGFVSSFEEQRKANRDDLLRRITENPNLSPSLSIFRSPDHCLRSLKFRTVD